MPKRRVYKCFDSWSQDECKIANCRICDQPTEHTECIEVSRKHLHLEENEYKEET